MATKILTAAEMWLRISRWCDYQERCHQEARDKLYALGLHKQEVEQYISKLIEEGFINEERFAIAFARGKFRIVAWGKIKIRLALQQKKVPDYCIKKALAALPADDYQATIKKLLASKIKVSGNDDPRKVQYAAARYVISRGFEPDLVRNYLGLEE